MSDKINVELSESELSMLVTVLHMGGWQRKKNLPKRLRNSDNRFIRKMSKIMSKLEEKLEDELS